MVHETVDARDEEVDMLRAMYCGEGEFVADPHDPFSFVISLSEGAAVIGLHVALPTGYPACRPDLRLHNDVLSRDEADDLMKELTSVLDASEDGQPALYEAVEWLKENGLHRVAAAHERADAQAISANSTSDDDVRKDLVRGTRCSMWAERGDLFEVGPEWALCHCVSKDFEMSAGIAAEFKRRFGGVDDLKGQNVDVGGVAVLEKKGRLMYYLVTKKGYRGKSTMESMELSLRAMKELMVARGVRKLALPQIGCGLDQLSWGAVRGLVLQIFDDVDVELLVRSR